MTSYLLDTHVWAWDLVLDQRLPQHLLEMMDSADSIYVSVISLYEITQKVRLQKWPEMEPFAGVLHATLTEQGFQVAGLTAEISQSAGMLDWDHRDPFDRIIAATSISMKLPVMSVDKIFDDLSPRKDWPGRIW